MKNLQSIVTALMLLIGTSASAQIVLLVQEPANLAGSYNFTYSSSNGWGADMDTVAITAPAAFAYDGSATEDSLACGEIINPEDIDGKIAVVYRGECNFSLKARNVQDSGAVALVIINNVPGAPVGMGAGSFAEDVHIPVVMISNTDGASLRDSIMSGSVEMFLGNNTGLFDNNLGSYKPNIAGANSYAIPVEYAQSSSDFSVPVGAWVYNFGNAEATNALVTAVIDRDGTEVYNETSAGANIPVGDSAFFTLPEYAEDGYEEGLYTITYTIVEDNTDEFPDDNVATASFWINGEGLYSKSTVDPVTGPVGGNGIRPADGTEYEWCIALQSENAEATSLLGITFATLTNDFPLTGEAVQLSVYEWNDPITGGTVSFDDLNELTDNEFYDYPSDLQDEFVTHTFSEPVELLNGQKYLACATIFTDDMFLSVDAGLDYNVMYETYVDEVFFPVHNIDGAAWFPGGFGTDNIPAIVVNLGGPFGIADDFEALDITPYPNPTTDFITIPMGGVINGEVIVDVYDAKGAIVLSETLCQKSDKLRLDVTELASGMHTFNLTFEDKTSTSFRVVVTK
ncbi:MAG: T9SS type A sorting domain-containing protein [Flavobacteriales bacterium]|nr:T9SS type A sorting domain-containing protein [Flavobacteriales bacterium]MCB9191855.1 T9SS type A sorting domain-containing protein [Flavobacteriales bacterium]MCB9204724.1 T9SS type A sorting domain-containing protein [Flavobacteriales bacterium]